MIVYTLYVYTQGVPESLSGFEWDVHSFGHVALHGVTPVEVEETTGRPHVIVKAASKRNEKRWKLFGTTAARRYLVVVFTIRHSKMRTVTAYSMNHAERRLYGPQIST